MKKLTILALFVFATIFTFSCNQKPIDNSSDVNSYSKITLPPNGGGSTTTIVIRDRNGNEYDTGIEDKTLSDGSTISQKIQECINNSRNHGDFVSCMAHLTNWLLKNSYITNKEKGILMNIAARADIP